MKLIDGEQHRLAVDAVWAIGRVMLRAVSLADVLPALDDGDEMDDGNDPGF